MSRQKKFYIEPRKPSGIYYYIVRDPVSRKAVVCKSTGTTDKKQAEANNFGLFLYWFISK